MSYGRMGHPLTDFEGNNEFYLYVSDKGLSGWANYEDRKSLAQFVVNVVEQELGDGKLARKLAKKLAKEWKLKLRKRRLSLNEYIKLMDKNMRKFKREMGKFLRD